MPKTTKSVDEGKKTLTITQGTLRRVPVLLIDEADDFPFGAFFAEDLEAMIARTIRDATKSGKKRKRPTEDDHDDDDDDQQPDPGEDDDDDDTLFDSDSASWINEMIPKPPGDLGRNASDNRNATDIAGMLKAMGATQRQHRLFSVRSSSYSHAYRH